MDSQRVTRRSVLRVAGGGLLAGSAAGRLAGVALAGSALAAYTPTIAVSHPVATGGAHPTTIHAKVAQTDDPTAQVQIFAPTGYTIAAAPPSTTLGKASGTVFARDTGLTLPLEGTVVAADPAQYVGPPNNQCSPGTHFAVWLLNLSVAGQTIAVPIYVDPTTGTQAGLGAYKLVACFSSPDTPVGSPNHAPCGAQLRDANFTVDSAITLPASAGTYVWRSLFTPYTPAVAMNCLTSPRCPTSPPPVAAVRSISMRRTAGSFRGDPPRFKPPGDTIGRAELTR